MEVTSDAGDGFITRLEDGTHRGDGIFLGQSQEELRAAYDELSKAKDEEPPFETLLLG